MLKFELQGRRGSWTIEAAGSLEAGCVGLFGRSGSGKSSLLEMIAGLLKPEGGVIRLGDGALFDSRHGVDVPPHLRGVGIVFQDHLLFPHLSVTSNLLYGRRFGRATGPRFEFEVIVDLLQLRPLLDRVPASLSGGERRRVAIGRALLSSPRLLLLDEPLTGLDEPLKADILALLQRIRDELRVPMIYVSHHLDEILRLTHQIWLIHEGRIVGAGAYGNLAQDARVLPHLLPLGLLNVLAVEIGEHETAAGCTRYIAGAGADGDGQQQRVQLRGPLVDAPVGARVSVSIRPEDIALAPAPVELISIRNQIPGTVLRHAEYGGRSLVEIDIGVPILVEVSTGSLRRLVLRAGSPTCCLIKATALQVLGFRRPVVD